MAKTDGFSLNDFLSKLENDEEKTAEEKVEETPVEEKAEEVVEEEKTAEEKPAEEEPAEVSEEDLEREKVAQLMEEGQIMARAFHEELTKLAVGDGPMTPNPAAVKEPNEVSHLSVGDIKLDQVAKVEALLNQIQMAVRSGGGDLTFTFNPGGPQPAGTVDESAVPADAASAQKSQAAAASMNKAAGDKIIDNLYKKVYGDE